MVEPITAIYAQEDDEWAITVAGLGKKVTAKAPGIIAARDRVDQLVEQLVPEGKATVVHLLNGSALEFTTAYMTARLTKPEATPSADEDEPAEKSSEKGETAESEPESAEKDEAKASEEAPTEPSKAKAETAAPKAEKATKAEKTAKTEEKAEAKAEATDKAKLDSLANNGKFAGVSALGGQPASQLSAPSGSVTMTETATPPAARA
ncbi:hypothetical protein [Amycolatopsis sp. CA-230715]|uniref:hypothetical protein n=1 Tax=Amycolatopsis sp. CA-230715 TaxID=2745196 RepID=UPI001C3328F4|nr:hypothetical protein [Amycolatopsis sp. CA-230715]QWF82609.1 hypothetical protein HUW46_06048 [Amycolatopsis sp. CA-230715]